MFGASSWKTLIVSSGAHTHQRRYSYHTTSKRLHLHIHAYYSLHPNDNLRRYYAYWSIIGFSTPVLDHIHQCNKGVCWCRHLCDFDKCQYFMNKSVSIRSNGQQHLIYSHKRIQLWYRLFSPNQWADIVFHEYAHLMAQWETRQLKKLNDFCGCLNSSHQFS